MYSMTVNVIFPIFTLNKYSFIHSFGTYIDSFNRGINLSLDNYYKNTSLILQYVK